MRKFNTRDRIFLNEAILAVLRESKKFEEVSEMLGKKPIITYGYWKMMAKDVMEKIEDFSTKKANKVSENYEQQMSEV